MNSIEHGKKHLQDAIFSFFMKSKIMSGRVRDKRRERREETRREKRDKRRDRELEFFMKRENLCIRSIWYIYRRLFEKFFSKSDQRIFAVTFLFTVIPFLLLLFHIFSLSFFLFRLLLLHLCYFLLPFTFSSINSHGMMIHDLTSCTRFITILPSLTLSIVRKICLFTGLDSIEEVTEK